MWGSAISWNRAAWSESVIRRTGFHNALLAKRPSYSRGPGWIRGKAKSIAADSARHARSRPAVAKVLVDVDLDGTQHHSGGCEPAQVGHPAAPGVEVPREGGIRAGRIGDHEVDHLPGHDVDPAGVRADHDLAVITAAIRGAAELRRVLRGANHDPRGTLGLHRCGERNHAASSERGDLAILFQREHVLSPAGFAGLRPG